MTREQGAYVQSRHLTNTVHMKQILQQCGRCGSHDHDAREKSDVLVRQVAHLFFDGETSEAAEAKRNGELGIAARTYIPHADEHPD